MSTTMKTPWNKVKQLLRAGLLCTALNVAATSTDAQIINTIAGTGAGSYTGDGFPAIGATLNNPRGIALDGAGNIYVADPANSVVRMINTSGIISTVAGNGTPGFGGDGFSALAANLNSPYDVAFDAAGDLYIADAANHCIRKVSGGIISTVAGTGGMPGFGGDGFPAVAANINFPIGIGFDGAGNLYIADNSNNRVRKVNTGGIISTFAGTGLPSFGGDGFPAVGAFLNSPTDVACDATGNVFISDLGNHRIRKVNGGGTISTIAGNGTFTISGDGGPAVAAGLKSPWNISFDGSGNLFIADQSGDVVRVINGAIINAVAGSGINGFSGDGGLAVLAKLAAPSGVAVDGSGNVYIGDASNNRVRMVSSGAPEAPHPCIDTSYMELSYTTDGMGNCLYTATATVGTINIVRAYSWDDGTSVVTHFTHAHTDVFNFTMPKCSFMDLKLTIYVADTSLADSMTDGCCQAMLTQSVTCAGCCEEPKEARHTTEGMPAAPGFAKGIRVFPNPTDNMVTVSSSNADITNIQVMDMNGKKVANHVYKQAQTANVSLGKLPPGSYVIRVNNSVSKTVTKVK